MSPLDYKLFYQRHLPHYQPPGATLFITFRLAGSLPREALQRMDAETFRLNAEIAKITGLHARKQAVNSAQKWLFDKWDAALDDARQGPKWLAEPALARLICDALHYRDGKQYKLDAYSVMPNHVHLVCSPLSKDGEAYPLPKILHSLKRYTARQANQWLGRQGDFWQHESYDHVVRDNEEFLRIVDYVLNNPLRAGLPAQWIYRRECM